MKTIDYAQELATYCKFDDLEEGKRVAKFRNATIIDDETVLWEYHCLECNAIEYSKQRNERDYVYIGSCPSEEDPFHEYTSNKACIAFLIQLKNSYTIPEGGSLQIKLELGGGGYYEVIANYDTRYPKSVAWALYLEGNMPERWSPAALKVLKGER